MDVIIIILIHMFYTAKNNQQYNEAPKLIHISGQSLLLTYLTKLLGMKHISEISFIQPSSINTISIYIIQSLSAYSAYFTFINKRKYFIHVTV